MAYFFNHSTLSPCWLIRSICCTITSPGELQIFPLFLRSRIVSSQVYTDPCSSDARRRVFCISPECSLHTTLLSGTLPWNLYHCGLLILPAVSFLLRVNSRLHLGSSFPYHSLETFQVTFQAHLVSFSSFGNDFPSFPDIQCLQIHCFCLVFLFFILWKPNFSDYVTIQSRIYLYFEAFSSTVFF